MMSKNNIEGMMLELTELLAGYGEGERLIEPISEAVKKAILRKTAYSLPDRPSAAGMTPEQIKAAFYKPITDGALSVLAEVDRIAEETDNNMVRFVGILSVFKGVIEALEKAQGHHGEELDAHGTGIQENSEQLEKLSRELTAAIAKCLKNEGVQVLDGSLTISGDIFVGGEAKAKQLESLLIEDACIVANAEGVPLAELSGYVIRVTESEAYAIVYDPFDECVKIGLGVYDGDAKVFTFNAGEAQALATRGDIKGGNIPVWNDEKKRFEDSGVSARAVSDLPSMESVAGALRGSASGTAVALKDVSQISHGLGVRVSSKNLIPFSYRGRLETIEGVTFTVNDDGSVTANGTATNRAQFLIYSSSNPFPIKAGTYTLSGCPQGGGDATYVLWSSKGQDHGKGKTFTLTEDTEMFLNITIMAGVTVNNLTFYPQIEEGTAATAYTPYVADTEAVKIKAQGKNLADPKIFLDNGGVLQDDGSIYFKTTSSIAKVVIYENKNQEDIVSMSYLLKTLINDGSSTSGVRFLAEYADGAKVNIGINTFANFAPIKWTSNTSKNLVRILGEYGSKDNSTWLKDIQIEINPSSTDYEPYIEPIEYGQGEVIKSIYPSTTLTTDTPGAIIEVEYNRDINKAFAELQQAIISLGGNV